MVKIENVSKIYSGSTPTYALDDVSLTLPKTGMVFIVGKSGSGKSTLLNIMAGFDKPTKGQLYFSSQRLDEMTPVELDHYRNEIIGFVFQDFCLIDNFTAKQNIRMVLDYQKRKVKNKEIDDILKLVDLEGLGKRYPRQLSAGQKQRVAIARALIKSPKIILADEPTGNLDSKTTKQILELLKEISKERLVVIVSHNKDDAFKYADRIIEISDGKIASYKYKNEEYNNEYYSSEEEVILPNKGRLSNEQLNEINEKIIKSKGKIKISKRKDEYLEIINKDNTDEDIKISKPKMGFWNLLKYSWLFFKNQIVSFALIVIIVSSLITTLSISVQFANYNGQTQYQEAVENSNSKAMFFKQDHPENDSENVDFSYMYELDNEALEKIQEDHPEAKCYDVMSFFLPILKTVQVDYSWNDTKNSSFNIFNITKLNNLVVCDKNYLDSIFSDESGGYYYIGDIDDPDGIIITDYVANSIMAAYTYYQAKTLEEVIDNPNMMERYGVKVSAIILTDYEKRRDELIGEKFDTSDFEKEEYADLADDILYKYGVAYTLNPNYYENYKALAISKISNYNIIKQEVSVNDIVYTSKNTYIGFQSSSVLAENEIILNADTYNSLFDKHCTSYDMSDFTQETVTYKIYDSDNNAYIDRQFIVKNLIFKAYNCLSVSLREEIISRNQKRIGISVLDYNNVSEMITQSKELDLVVTNSRIMVVESAISVVMVFKELFELLSWILVITIIVLVIVNAINTINKSIYNIGVSRAMGAHMSEMAFIYSSQMISFGLFVVIISLVLDKYSVQIINKIIQDNISKLLELPGVSSMNYLIYDPAIVSACTILVVILTIISLFFPILTIRLMNPVNIIKSRH